MNNAIFISCNKIDLGKIGDGSCSCLGQYGIFSAKQTKGKNKNRPRPCPALPCSQPSPGPSQNEGLSTRPDDYFIFYHYLHFKIPVYIIPVSFNPFPFLGEPAMNLPSYAKDIRPPLLRLPQSSADVIPDYSCTIFLHARKCFA